MALRKLCKAWTHSPSSLAKSSLYHCVIYIRGIKLARYQNWAKYELIHRSSRSYRQLGYKNRCWHLPCTVKRFQAWDRWMSSSIGPSFLTSRSYISEIKKAEWKAWMKGPGRTRNWIESRTEHLHELWAAEHIASFGEDPDQTAGTMSFDSHFDTEEIDFVHIAQIMQRRRDSTVYYREALCMPVDSTSRMTSTYILCLDRSRMCSSRIIKLSWWSRSQMSINLLIIQLGKSGCDVRRTSEVAQGANP